MQPRRRAFTRPGSLWTFFTACSSPSSLLTEHLYTGNGLLSSTVLDFAAFLWTNQKRFHRAPPTVKGIQKTRQSANAYACKTKTAPSMQTLSYGWQAILARVSVFSVQTMKNHHFLPVSYTYPSLCCVTINIQTKNCASRQRRSTTVRTGISFGIRIYLVKFC